MAGMQLREDWYEIHRKAYPSVIVVCICLFTYLFYRMATADIVTNHSPYYSDLIFHIRTAMTDTPYSIMEVFEKYLFMMPYDMASLSIAVVCALLQILAVYSTYILLLELDKVIGRETSTFDRAVYQWFSLLSIFFVTVFLPLPLMYYIGALPLSCWQNETYFGMRPFSILALVFFIRMYNDFHNGLKARDVLGFCITLTISTGMKPNFFIGFAVFLLLFALWLLVKKDNKLTVFKRIVIVALCTVPSLLVMLLQSTVLFGGSDGGEGIIIAPFAVMNIRVCLWPIAYVVLLAFPIAVWRHEYGPSDKKPFAYVMIWVVWIIMNLFGLLLAEGGTRLNHFNFAWGLTLANGLLFVVSYYLWYHSLCSGINRGTIVLSNDPVERVVPKYYWWGGWFLLYITIIGLVYFILILIGVSFADL